MDGSALIRDDAMRLHARCRPAKAHLSLISACRLVNPRAFSRRIDVQRLVRMDTHRQEDIEKKGSLGSYPSAAAEGLESADPGRPARCRGDDG